MSTILTIHLCETQRVALKPDTLYRFTVDPDCVECRRCAAVARGDTVPRAPLPIPVTAAARIADRYAYDQVLILARNVGPTSREHVTTYGRTAVHCDIAAATGAFLKHRIMGWPQLPTASTDEVADLLPLQKATNAETNLGKTPAYALADEREAGYRAREHGGVVNGRIADKLVTLAETLR